jgi:hypothetical protein
VHQSTAIKEINVQITSAGLPIALNASAGKPWKERTVKHSSCSRAMAFIFSPWA